MPFEHAIHDEVVLRDGSHFIITAHKPRAQKYIYLAVRANTASGAQYKLSAAQISRNLGQVDKSHRALAGLASRTGGLSPVDKEALQHMLTCLDNDDLQGAKAWKTQVERILA